MVTMQADTEHEMDLATALVAKEALMLHHCADNRRIVPLLFIGLCHPTLPHMPVNPCLVEYFGMPVADLSLDKLFG